MPVRWDSVRLSRIRGGVYRDGDLGAIQLAHGARDNLIDGVVVEDSGIPSAGKGSALWLFRGCTRNRITNITISGDCYHGVYIDDRTSTSTEWDAPCDDNTVTAPAVNIARSGSNSCLMVVGGSGNQFIGGTIAGTRSGVIIDANQINSHDGARPHARGNLVEGVSMRGHAYPLSLAAPGNRIVNVTWRDCQYGPQDSGGNAIEASGLDPIQGSTFATTTMPPGYHWTLPTTQPAESTDWANAALVVSEWVIPRSLDFDEVGIEVINPASSGRLRWGYWYDDGTGRPGQMAWDAGTLYLDLTAAGIQYVPVTRTIRPGRYWIGAAVQLWDGATPPTLRIPGGGVSVVASQVRPSPGRAVQGYRHASAVNGSLPRVFDVAGSVAAVPAFYTHITT